MSEEPVIEPGQVWAGLGQAIYIEALAHSDGRVIFRRTRGNDVEYVGAERGVAVCTPEQLHASGMRPA